MEKKAERKEEQGAAHIAEVHDGAFSRTLPVPAGIDCDHVTSTFKKGVLRLTLPKSEEAKEHRWRIQIEITD